MSKTTVKPFTQLIDAADQTIVEVDLTDSNGDAVECNWIKVVAVQSDNLSTPFVVQVSGIQGSPQSFLDASGSAPASGVVGMGGNGDSRGGSPAVELNLADSHRVTQIQLYAQRPDAANTIFSVTYGYRLFTRNPLRGGRLAQRATGS